MPHGDGQPDLRDVPEEHVQEVRDALNAIEASEPLAMGIDELRKQLEMLRRLCGFSREASLRLCEVIMGCLSDNRTGAQSLESMQRAFVRMGGVKQMIHLMLLRLSDAKIVEKCAQVLASAVQGSPLAAEAMISNPEDKTNVVLLLRAIERHVNNNEVCLQGCLLISHLCAPLPRSDVPACPARARAHRECQTLIADAGTIDLLISILGESMKLMRDVTLKAQALQKKQRALGDESTRIQVVTRQQPKAKSLQASVTGVQDKINLRLAWAKVLECEVHAAKVQGAALQALVLIACGNAGTTRLLAGSLWTWQTTKLESLADNIIGDIQTDVVDAKAKLAAKRAARAKKKGKGKGKGKASSRPDSPPPIPEPEDEVEPDVDPFDIAGSLEGDGRRRMGTFEAFAKTLLMPAEVLRSQTAKDRPELAVKACNIIALMCDLQLQLIYQVNENVKKHELMLHLHAEPKYREAQSALLPRAPFVLIETVVEALTLSLRTHCKSIPLISADLDALALMRQVAMKSAPAGCPVANKELEMAWQKMLRGANKEDELRKSALILEEAFRDTAQGNQRIARLGVRPSDFTGDGSFLTPRMLAQAKKSHQSALELASDSLNMLWEEQREEHWSKFQQAQDEKAAKAAAEAAEKAGVDDSDAPAEPSSARSSAVAKGGRKGGKGSKGAALKREVSSPKSRMSDESDEDNSPGRGKKGKGKSAKGKAKGKDGKDMEEGKKIEEEANQDPPLDWVRAIGFGTHDEADFDRVWRKPLEEVLSRSFSDTVLHRPSLAPLPGSTTAGQAGPPPVAMDLRGRMEAARPSLAYLAGMQSQLPLGPDALSEHLDLQMIESQPGKLRVRVVVPSKDKVRQTVSDRRLTELVESNQHTSLAMTQEISKHLRRHGCLLPKYGLQVSVKKLRQKDLDRERLESADQMEGRMSSKPSDKLPPLVKNLVGGSG